MPLARRVITIDSEDKRLVDALYQEWAHPSTQDEPVIIEEVDEARLRPVHLYVVWSKWAELSQVDRSKIILDAYERLRGRDLTLSVTVAMGLTSAEAHRLGIDFEEVKA